MLTLKRKIHLVLLYNCQLNIKEDKLKNKTLQIVTILLTSAVETFVFFHKCSIGFNQKYNLLDLFNESELFNLK